MEHERIKILAIDDQQDNLITLRALMVEAFPEAVIQMALNGTAGLELAAEAEPDVILLDIVMPGMDGFEVCRKLKADEVLRDIPVVFVTALKGDRERRIMALECGAEAFLAKPIDEVELTAQIRAMVKIKAANIEKRTENSRLASLVEEQTLGLKNAHLATLKLLEELKIEIEVRKLRESELRESEEEAKREQVFSKAIIESIPGTFYVLDENGRYVGWNSYQRDEIVGKPENEIAGMNSADTIHPDDRALIASRIANVLINGVDEDVEGRVLLRGGPDYRCLLMTGRRAIIGSKTLLVGVGMDITERKQAEEKKAALEAQLHQAQKMESVGRLAGGVAHDFNNMLSVIMGHAEMALMRMDQGLPLYASLTEILKAAQRSADLTRQLLAFARKQTVAPKVIDLNETVADMLSMLQRLIGENTHLTWKPGVGLWPVFVDTSQIDQIMANLCVNARDAIADIGKIIIETKDCSIGENYCKAHPYASPGDYVKIIVSDNGKGMDKETLDHIFEPFFTTKGVGEGTGLGLATVYGIVKQNNGFINVYSEPGTGTTFTIYLPRYEGKADEAQKGASTEKFQRGHETILLVEDESAILEMTTMLLQELGYTVLKASSPGAAVRTAREHVGEIHLLMTDVIMPEMNGRDLAKNLLSSYPHIKRLFMSGYTADIIAHHGVLDEGVNFIQKPFYINALAARLREVLDGR